MKRNAANLAITRLETSATEQQKASDSVDKVLNEMTPDPQDERLAKQSVDRLFQEVADMGTAQAETHG